MMAPLLQGATNLTLNRNDRLLAAHNRERAAYGLPPLNWSEKLARSSAGWAKHLQALGDLEHSHSDPNDPDPEGENLWAGTRGYYSPEAMVGLWISEKRNFKPGVFPNNTKTGRLEDVGHYTQLMWRSSTDVGCAVAANAKEEFLVCRYSEGGNVIGEEPF